jgi:hypothetical protein
VPASSIALPPDVRDFFDRYRDAFDRLDGDAVARLYATPSGMVSGGRYVHWADFASARANMVALCEHYRTSGHVRSTWEPATVLAQGREALIVDVVWSIERRGIRSYSTRPTT